MNHFLKLTTRVINKAHIVEIIKSSKEPKMPEVNWKWNESQVDIIIDEQSLEGQITELTFFIKKLDIKNINESIMKKLVENGIDSIIKIINIEWIFGEGLGSQLRW